MLSVTPIEAFSDNYIWCLRKPDGREAVVVDPGDGDAVLAALDERGLELAGIMITHHHFDHTGGLGTLLAHRRVPVWGPGNPAITQIGERLGEGDVVAILDTAFEVFEVPGHTLDHIAFFAEGSPPLLFCGDTLFAGGCGRMFEGDAATMYSSLGKLAGLPADTRVYCAHEYTLANLDFAAAVEPDNGDLKARIADAGGLRARNIPTVPSRLATELATNPFLRFAESAVASRMQPPEGVDPADPVAVFGGVRAWKDEF